MNKNARRLWVLPVTLLAGALIGSLLYMAALRLLPPAWDVAFTIGTAEPWAVDLHVVRLSLGVGLHLNPA